MNTYQAEQLWNDINVIIGFSTSIITIGFMVGMTGSIGKLFNEALKEPFTIYPWLYDKFGGKKLRDAPWEERYKIAQKVGAQLDLEYNIPCKAQKHGTVEIPLDYYNDNKDYVIDALDEITGVKHERPWRQEKPKSLYGRKLERRKLESPTAFYHVTDELRWKRIQKEGLVPMVLNPQIRRATGLEKGIFLGGDEEVVDMMSLGLTEEAFEEHPELNEIILVILEVTVSTNTILIEDPEFLGAEWPGGAWIIGRAVPIGNIRLLKKERIKREEWE